MRLLFGIISLQFALSKIHLIQVGDSLTEFCPLKDLFDPNRYDVSNFGSSGRTLIKNEEGVDVPGFNPYWDTNEIKSALKSWPDAVLIMFGTNDAKHGIWDEDKFTKYYLEMANTFIGLKTKPEVFLGIPPPLYKDGVYAMN